MIKAVHKKQFYFRTSTTKKFFLLANYDPKVTWSWNFGTSVAADASTAYDDDSASGMMRPNLKLMMRVTAMVMIVIYDDYGDSNNGGDNKVW